MGRGVDLIDPLVAGDCNVTGTKNTSFNEKEVIEAGFTGDWAGGRSVYTRDTSSIITYGGDTRFADFVNWVMYALMLSEARNITKEDAASLFPSALPFGNNDAGLAVVDFKAKIDGLSGIILAKVSNRWIE